MEEVLSDLARDATSGKQKAIREACMVASDALLLNRTGGRKLQPYELRRQCLLPLKLALESRASKLSLHAVNGLQKLISDDRFGSSGEENVECQLPVQFLNTVAFTPSLSDEVQVEIMKLLLIITCSASCEVHGEYLIKIVELCIETYIRAHQQATKTACRATLTQMLSTVCHRLQDSLAKAAASKLVNTESKTGKYLDTFYTDTCKILGQDVVLLLKHFCFRLTAGPSAQAQSNQALPLYLEAILVMLASCSTALQQNREFVSIIWQLLCPALIQLLGSPMTDLSRKPKPNGAYVEEIHRGGRGTGSFSKASPVVGPISRIIYNIATELLRLVGPVAAMRPVLESLFHRIILYPPPQQRTEALKALKEILSSPQRLLDAAGPTIIDKDNPPSPDSPTEQKKTDLDLLRLLLDGIVESAHCNDSIVAGCSVACVVALLGSLEDLSQGRGLNSEHIEWLSKTKDPDNWEELYQSSAVQYENAASARDVPKFTVSDETFDDDESERRSKPKHIRWQMDQRGTPDGGIDSVTERFLSESEAWESEDERKEGEEYPVQIKSVHFAPRDEVTMFTSNELERRGNKSGIPQLAPSGRRRSIPRRAGNNSPNGARATVKRSSSFEGKSRPNVSHRRGRHYDTHHRRENSEAETDLKAMNIGISRSYTDIDVIQQKRSNETLEFPLRRSNSWTALTTAARDGNEQDASGGNRRSGYPQDMNGDVPRRGRLSSDSSMDHKEDTRQNMSDERPFDLRSRILKDVQKTYVESKAVKLELKEGLSTKLPRPILRRTRSAGDFDRKQQEAAKAGKPRGILIKTQSTEENEDLVKTRKPQNGVKINGVFVNRGRDHKGPVSPKTPPENKRVSDMKKSVEENEKEGARNFTRCLLGILPSVLALNDCLAVDEALQQFASDVCEAITCMALKRKNVPNFGTLRGRSDLLDEKTGEGATSEPHFPILNADGVYVTVYGALSLNLKLLRQGHYQKKNTVPHITQQEFVKGIQDSGVPMGLSSVWLGELYRLVTTYNVLGKAGYKLDGADSNRALIDLLSDNVSVAERESGDTPFIHIEGLARVLPAKKEGMKFARRVLVTTWDSLLEVLSLPLETSTTGIGGPNSIALMLGTDLKRDHNRERDTICLSLDGLRRAARLCCTLGIQPRCEQVLAHLANASCGIEAYGTTMRPNKLHTPSIGLKLHAAHVLSMDGLLAVGVELGNHAPKCWKHVFRCCFYISQLERLHFLHDPSHPSSVRTDLSSPLSESSNISDYLSGDTSPNTADGSRPTSEHEADGNPSDGGLLTPADASRAVYALSAAVDRLFEHAANTLQLQGLISFLQELVTASRAQLYGTASHNGAPANTTGYRAATTATVHLYRLADVMIRSARNTSRPLLHIMMAWSVISPHFIEAASHKDRNISKMAITSLNDILNEVLANRNELPHFWFHELLLQPFTTVIQSDLCGEDEQEQILSTFTELVDRYTTSLKSGWRPLLRALRAVRPHFRLENFESDQRSSPALDIVSAFLSNKNPSVFAAATVECIHVLIKLVRGMSHEDAYDDSRSETESLSSEASTMSDLCLSALEHVAGMSKKLSAIYVMPSSLIFHGARSIRMAESILLSQKSLNKLSENELKTSRKDFPSPISAPASASSITAIDVTGILRVWFLLLEGLTNAVVQCPKRYQPQTLEVLFDILRSVTTVPGPNFSIYAVTHLLLPMLQSWVKRGNRSKVYWENTAANFKHACGLATELVVQELNQYLSVQGASECVPGMMHQMLELLIECVSQHIEGIARLGCSCLRHLLLTAGPLFTEDLWQIVCDGLKETIQATLINMKDMISCFQPGSNNVSGDEGMNVRVVARRDASHSDLLRLQQVAEQVFLLDNQMFDPGTSPRKNESRDLISDEEEPRSYVFVLSAIENKDKPEAAKRVPLCGLLISVLSHQLLLQTLGSILLDSSDINSPAPQSNGTPLTAKENCPLSSPDVVLPGLLCHLSPANLSVLFDCLMESHTVAYEFNARPGLRSLIQKLTRLKAPANLLRQSATAFTYYLHTLFHICRHSGEYFSSSHIKRILTGDRGINHDKDVVMKEEVFTSPGTNRHNDLLKGDRNVDWIVKRLHEACDQLSSVYVRLFNQYSNDTYYALSDETGPNSLDTSVLSISSLPSPAREVAMRGHLNDELLNSPISGPKRRLSSSDNKPERTYREPKSRHSQYEEELRILEMERQQQEVMLRREDEMLQLSIWTGLVITMLEQLLALPTLQFKAVLPAVFSAVTCLIATGTDPKVRQLVSDVIKRVGFVYGIM